MQLEIGSIPISDVRFSEKTEIKNGTLCINKNELLGLLKDERIKSAEVFITLPGDSVRIIPVKDVIEPRVKVSGSGGIFPGFISNTEQVGSGRTHVLT